MRGDGSLGYWYLKAGHSSFLRRNGDGKSSEEEGIEVSPGKEMLQHSYLDTSHTSSSNHGGRESCGYISQETSHSTSSNGLVCERRSSLMIHSSSSNRRLYHDRDGSRSQETSHYSYHIHLFIFILSTTHTGKDKSQICLSGIIDPSFLPSKTSEG